MRRYVRRGKVCSLVFNYVKNDMRLGGTKMKKKFMRMLAVSLAGIMTVMPIEVLANDQTNLLGNEIAAETEIVNNGEGVQQPDTSNLLVSNQIISETQKEAVWEVRDNGYALIKDENDGERTYFTRADGFVHVGEAIYLFNENEIMCTGLQQIKDMQETDNGTYYFQEESSEYDEEEPQNPVNSNIGQMQKNIVIELEGQEYSFDETGKVIVQEEPVIEENGENIEKSEIPAEAVTDDIQGEESDAEKPESDVIASDVPEQEDKSEEDVLPEESTEVMESDKNEANETEIDQEVTVEQKQKEEKKNTEKVTEQPTTSENVLKQEIPEIATPKVNQMENLLGGTDDSGIETYGLNDESVNIDLNRTYSGSITQYETRDVYRVIIPYDGIVNFKTIFHMENMSIGLYEEDGTQLEDYVVYWNDNISQGINEKEWPLSAGTYYLVFRPYRYNKNYGAYTFNLQYSDIHSGEKESNDSMSNAQKISTNKSINGLLAINESSDIFYVDLKKAGKLQINFRAYIDNVMLIIYDSAGEEITSYHPYWNDNIGYSNNSYKVDVVGGRYYIQICPYRYSVCKGKYALQIASPQMSTVTNGWVYSGGNTYYYINGAKATGWRTIAGSRYYFAQSSSQYGKMLKGWQQIGSYKYYFAQAGSRPGQMLKGWQKIGSQSYYFAQGGTKPGRMLKGWQKIGNYTYYFAQAGTKAGQMLKGWQKIGNYTYYFAQAGTKPGHMLKGWQRIGSTWYYFDAKGRRA